METLGLAEKADVVEECASSSAVTANFFTPMRSHSSCSGHSDAEAASSVFYSARIAWLSELRSKFDTQLGFDVEASKSHWTELSAESDDSDVQVPNSATTADSDASDEQVPNSVVFEMMKEHPLWGPLFRKKIHELEMGAKIAEGGQAEIFEAHGRDPPFGDPTFSAFVLKVFKKGYSLVDLQRSWPRALATAVFPQTDAHESSDDLLRCLCLAVGVHLMDDGRFAFVFRRHLGDLRMLIDKNMLERNGCPPFDIFFTHTHICNIAVGMHNLHKVGILHNDLKAANVLIKNVVFTIVADFESSVGIVGTGFWRAPEILLALKNRNLKPETFTQKSDVYSFAMTCYEVITGNMPFEDHDKWDYDIVLRGERPTLPNDPPYSMFNDLVTRCWYQDPLKRPSFEEILRDLRAISNIYSLSIYDRVSRCFYEKLHVGQCLNP